MHGGRPIDAIERMAEPGSSGWFGQRRRTTRSSRFRPTNAVLEAPTYPPPNQTSVQDGTAFTTHRLAVPWLEERESPGLPVSTGPSSIAFVPEPATTKKFSAAAGL